MPRDAAVDRRLRRVHPASPRWNASSAIPRLREASGASFAAARSVPSVLGAAQRGTTGWLVAIFGVGREMVCRRYGVGRLFGVKVGRSGGRAVRLPRDDDDWRPELGRRQHQGPDRTLSTVRYDDRSWVAILGFGLASCAPTSDLPTHTMEGPSHGSATEGRLVYAQIIVSFFRCRPGG